jgi:seryl-tRNA synthetase
MVRDGVFFPTQRVGNLERELFRMVADVLKLHDFQYLSVPSTITRDTIERQGVVAWEHILRLSDTHGLAGSAEQGILEMFKGQRVGGKNSQLRVFADNQCFRNEREYVGFKYLREFRKLEQFVFCDSTNWEENFELVMKIAKSPLILHGIEYRVVDVTNRDPGYHKLKKDIEVFTAAYGWLETHSCTYFGEEQTKRFEVTGLTHTISNTGLASPRILVPFLEQPEKFFSEEPL